MSMKWSRSVLVLLVGFLLGWIASPCTHSPDKANPPLTPGLPKDSKEITEDAPTQADSTIPSAASPKKRDPSPRSGLPEGLKGNGKQTSAQVVRTTSTVQSSDNVNLLANPALPRHLVKGARDALVKAGGSVPSLFTSANRYKCGEFVLYTAAAPNDASLFLATSSGQSLLFLADSTPGGTYESRNLFLAGTSAVGVMDTDRDGAYDLITYPIIGEDGKYDGLFDDFAMDRGLDGQTDMIVDGRKSRARRMYVEGAWHEVVFTDKGLRVATGDGLRRTKRIRTGYKFVHTD